MVSGLGRLELEAQLNKTGSPNSWALTPLDLEAPKP